MSSRTVRLLGETVSEQSSQIWPYPKWSVQKSLFTAIIFERGPDWFNWEIRLVNQTKIDEGKATSLKEAANQVLRCVGTIIKEMKYLEYEYDLCIQ